MSSRNSTAVILVCTSTLAVCAFAFAACDKPSAKDDSTPLGQAVTNTGARASLPATDSPDPIAAAENE